MMQGAKNTTGLGEQTVIHQSCQSSGADAEAHSLTEHLLEKMASSQFFQRSLIRAHRIHSFVNVSSRFSSAFEIMVHAANSALSWPDTALASSALRLKCSSSR